MCALLHGGDGGVARLIHMIFLGQWHNSQSNIEDLGSPCHGNLPSLCEFGDPEPTMVMTPKLACWTVPVTEPSYPHDSDWKPANHKCVCIILRPSSYQLPHPATIVVWRCPGKTPSRVLEPWARQSDCYYKPLIWRIICCTTKANWSTKTNIYSISSRQIFF